MNLLNRSLLAAVSFLLVASQSLAEVRLEARASGSLQVIVSDGALGTWSPTGPVDEWTLNPAGDLRGDGAPRLSEPGANVLAAWRRGAGDGLAVAQGDAGGWSEPTHVAGPAAIGMPQFVQAFDGTVLGYQGLDEVGEATVFVAYLGPEGSTQAQALAHGRLLASWGGLETAHFLVLEGTDPADAELALFSFSQKPIIPIEFDRMSLDLRPLDADLSEPLVTHEALRGARFDNGQGSALAWWWDDTHLGVVALDVQGSPLGPVVTRDDPKGRRYSPALLNELLRELR